MMRAPRPTLICCATHDFFDINGTWKSYRDAKRLYGRLGFAERMDIIEVDEKHGYNQPLREASVRFMLRWLAGRDEAITEPEIQLLSDEELRSSPDGQVMRIEGAVSAFDICRAESQKLAETRPKSRQQVGMDQFRKEFLKVAGIRNAAKRTWLGVFFKKDFTRDRVEYNSFALKVEDGVYLPVVVAKPAGKKTTTVNLVLHDQGKSVAFQADGKAEKALGNGETVVAVDLRGVGETFGLGSRWYSGRFGPDSKDIATAYLLGLNYVGMRTNDILTCTDWIREEFGKDVTIRLSAHGHLCTPALHAAFVEPDRFEHMRLTGGLISWSNLMETPIHQDQFVNVIHGALRYYDLPDLVRALGDKIQVESPVDATGAPTVR